MKLKTSTIERYHLALLSLYIKVKSEQDVSANEFCKERRISSNFVTGAITLGYLEKLENKRYRWLANSAPTTDDAKKIHEYINVPIIDTHLSKSADPVSTSIAELKTTLLDIKSLVANINDTTNATLSYLTDPKK